MSNFEFLEYIPTPNEKHLGIATVMLFGRVFHKYKILPAKDGKGFFPVPASYKVGDTYIHAFGLALKKDGSDNGTAELINLIRDNVKRIMANASNSNSKAPTTNQNQYQVSNQGSNQNTSSNSEYGDVPF
jgi:hypothetical protein